MLCGTPSIRATRINKEKEERANCTTVSSQVALQGSCSLTYLEAESSMRSRLKRKLEHGKPQHTDLQHPSAINRPRLSKMGNPSNSTLSLFFFAAHLPSLVPIILVLDNYLRPSHCRHINVPANIYPL